jgi:hypothetical protein
VASTLQPFREMVGDRRDLPRGATAAHHHAVGDGALVSDVEDSDILRLVFVQ